MAKVGVIGAGISGLAIARELASAGHEVVVFEAGETSGGLLGTQEIDGFLLERAASSFVDEEHGAASLAGELGVALEEAAVETKKRWVYIDGELQEVPTSARQLLTSHLIGWRGKIRALTEPLQPTSPGADESIAEFSRRRLGEQVTRALVDPFVRGIYAGDSEQLSLRASFPSLAALEARGGLARGIAAGKVEAVFSRMQGQAIATNHGQQMLSPVGGIRVLVSALAAEMGESIRLSTTIAGMEKSDGHWLLHDATGQQHQVDTVVLATPAPVSAALVAPLHAEMAAALREIPYASVAVVGLGFAKEQINHSLDGLGFLVGSDEGLRIMGAYMESTAWSGRCPPDSVLVRCIMGGTSDPEILDLSDEEIAAQATADLETTLGITAVPTMTHLVRWPRAIPQYNIGHLARVDIIEAGASALGIVVGGSAIRGVSLNDCIKNARKVAEAVALLAPTDDE